MHSGTSREKVLLKPALHLKDRSQYNCFIGLRLSEIYMGSCPGATRMHVLSMSSKNCFRVKYQGRHNEGLPISPTEKGYIDNSILKIKSHSNATINVVVIILLSALIKMVKTYLLTCCNMSNWEMVRIRCNLF